MLNPLMHNGGGCTPPPPPHLPCCLLFTQKILRQLGKYLTFPTFSSVPFKKEIHQISFTISQSTFVLGHALEED